MWQWGDLGREGCIMQPGLYLNSNPPGSNDIVMLLNEKKIAKEYITVIMEVIEMDKQTFTPELN